MIRTPGILAISAPDWKPPAGISGNPRPGYGTCVPLANEKAFHAFLRTLVREDWVVYAKRPFGGPEHVLHYLARYTHRVAISNHRIVDVTDTHVTFRWKEYAHQNKRRTMTLTQEEFLPLSRTHPAEGIPAHSLFRISSESASR
jgi:hypothetical protein